MANTPLLQVPMSFVEFVYMIISIIVLGPLCVWLLKLFSSISSKLGVYHKNETIKTRMMKLYYTYFALMVLVTCFVVVTTFTIVPIFASNVTDYKTIVNNMDIVIVWMAVTSSLLLSIRIYVTTGLISNDAVEEHMGLKWNDLRERILSTLYSLLVTIIILLCFGIIMTVLNVHSNVVGKVDDLMDITFYVNMSFIKLFICIISFPLILASIGEVLRKIASYYSPPPPDMIK